MNITRRNMSNKQWRKLQPLLPPERPYTGRPNKSHRWVINGICWILRTGAPWRDLPKCYGPWSSVYSRFRRWKRAGVWQHIWDVLQQQEDDQGLLDWNNHYVDGTIIRAHQHAAGARKKGTDGKERTQDDLALGRSQGGFSTKVHVRIEGKGRPMVIILTAGQHHESQSFLPLMNGGKVKLAGRGRPKHRPKRVVGDKGYSAHWIRTWARKKGIIPVIPRKKNECRKGPFNKAVYRERNRVERFINRAKQNRRIATRYEKLDDSYLAMWQIAAIFIWL